jgi:hypothetical protein
MGMGLRGVSRVSTTSNNGSDSIDPSTQKKVIDGRNRLKNMVVGELNLKKPPLTISS